MIRKILSSPRMYEISQMFWYRRAKQAEYVRTYASPRSGEKVLDIGCGVGSVAQYFHDVTYDGFDADPAYVNYANRKYGSLARFSHGEIGKDVSIEQESYDLVMANGILHHLDDLQVLELLRLSYRALRHGGRFLTRDGCFEDGQGAVARLLLLRDRGKHVRTREGYQTLIEQIFPDSHAIVRRDMMRLPYSLIIFQCRK
jgi:SAM-dependent methyltransferase